MLQDEKREKNVNKKSVKFIFPRQQIQDRRNAFEGSRTAALLESEQNSVKAHAKSCTKAQEASATKHSTWAKSCHSKGTGRKTNLPDPADELQSVRCCRDRHLCRKSLPSHDTATSKESVFRAWDPEKT